MFSLNTVKIYFRIAKLSNIFISEIIKFYCSNFLYYHVCKLSPLNRLELIKKISKKLEKENIVYVKIFQALCLDKDLLYANEIDYLIKYTDNVPYNVSEINYALLNKLEEDFSITLNNLQPINSGIVGLVFDGCDASNNKVIIKMLKNNILERFVAVFDELLYISYILNLFPYIRSLKITKLLLNNKDIILNQMDFSKELYAIEIFTDKYKNKKEYRFPKVYKEITEKYENLLVMENIKGLTFKDIESFNMSIKEEFGYLFNKFGMLGILYHSVIHCDLHSGNVFFYINENSSDEDLPKYQLGIIDFGLSCFPNKENQYAYYIFFSDMHFNNDYSSIEQLAYSIIEEKERFTNLDPIIKQEFLKESIECLQVNTKDDISSQLLVEFSKILTKYDFNFTEEFNKVMLGIHTVNSLGKQLCKNLKSVQMKVIKDLTKINDLLEF